jgi:hypothetical protein
VRTRRRRRKTGRVAGCEYIDGLILTEPVCRIWMVAMVGGSVMERGGEARRAICDENASQRGGDSRSCDLLKSPIGESES